MLTPEQRSERARQGARKRYAKVAKEKAERLNKKPAAVGFVGRHWPDYGMDEVAEILTRRCGRKVTSQNALRLLRRYGAVRLVKGRYYTSEKELRECCQHIWDELLLDQAEADDSAEWDL